MEKLEWSEDFELGSEPIDSEHKKLIELVACFEKELHSSDAADLDLEKMTQLAQELVATAITHLSDEELLIDNLSFMPPLEKMVHKQEHAEWRERLLKEVSSLLSSPSDLERRARLSNGILIARNFWDKHFQKVDTRLRIFIGQQKVLTQSH